MSRYHYKLAKKDSVISWYKSLKEDFRKAVYIEQTLGSNDDANVHLCVNTKPNRTIIARIGRRGMDWFELKPLQSQFLNEKYFSVLGLKIENSNESISYIYRGDRMTDPNLKGISCTASLRADGKCIRGRNGNMLVEINGKKTVVLARQLRKIRLTCFLLLVGFISQAQCEDSDASGSASFHYSAGKHHGWGGELGQQGLVSPLSFFLGINLTRIQGSKTMDSLIKRQDLIYLKGIYRVYQSPSESLNIGIVVAPGLLGPWLEVMAGSRILYVTGRHTAISLEPIYFLMDKSIRIHLNIHFLL